VPVLISPAHNAVTTDLTPRLDWGLVTVPPLTTFDHYELQLAATDGSFTSTITTSPLTAHEYTPVVNLAAGKTFTWKVRSWNTAGDSSSWSVTRSFRTAP
jgi:predicted phage tail protein